MPVPAAHDNGQILSRKFRVLQIRLRFNGANNALIASAAWPNRAALCTRGYRASCETGGDNRRPVALFRRLGGQLSSRNRFVSAHARAAARRPKVPRRLPASTGSGCRIGSVQSTAPQYLAPSCARFDKDIGTHQLYGGPRRRHLRRPTQHEPGSRQREGSPVRIGVDISAYTLDPSTSRVTSDLAMVCGQNPNVRIPRIHTVRRDLGWVRWTRSE